MNYNYTEYYFYTLYFNIIYSTIRKEKYLFKKLNVAGLEPARLGNRASALSTKLVLNGSGLILFYTFKNNLQNAILPLCF